VILLEHYRLGVNRRVLEIVGGVADDTDATIEDTVSRELEEELGLRDTHLIKTGVAYANPSSHTNRNHMYLALGGTVYGEQLKEDAADFRIIKMPFTTFYQMITRPDEQHVMQSFHLANIFYGLNFLRHTDDASEQVMRLRAVMLG
jgi:8-oxo-dGTP pyrophosphatase MutT (NUDIX family)